MTHPADSITGNSNHNRSGLRTGQAAATTVLTRELRVLFLSSGNAARSQIAEAVLRRLSRDRVRIVSAGIRREPWIHPQAQAAVRRVLSMPMDGQYPKLLDEFIGQPFGYVFTLSDDATEHHSRVDARCHIHWEIDDPTAVVGGADERQRAFDGVARQLLKRLRRWWHDVEVAEASRLQSLSRQRDGCMRPPPSSAAAPLDVPRVVVIYRGTPRRCSNMCGDLRRSGYEVVCADNATFANGTSSDLPDAVVIRMDGEAPGDGMIRPEFSTLWKFTNTLPPSTPLLMLIDRLPSTEEQVALQAMNVLVLTRRKPWTVAHLVRALDELIRPERLVGLNLP